MIRRADDFDYNDILNLGKDFVKNNLDFKNPFSINKVYLIDENIVGYINYSVMYEKAELNYLYVSENYRENKVASKLLENMIEDCFNKLVREITLEVRISNQKAIKLYKKYGFEIHAVRKNYYPDGEDAYLMIRTLVMQ